MAKLKWVEFRKKPARVLIRVGKNITEIAGDASDLREWSRQPACDEDEAAVKALLREHAKTDRDFSDLAKLRNRDVSVELKNLESVDG